MCEFRKQETNSHHCCPLPASSPYTCWYQSLESRSICTFLAPGVLDSSAGVSSSTRSTGAAELSSSGWASDSASGDTDPSCWFRTVKSRVGANVDSSTSISVGGGDGVTGAAVGGPDTGEAVGGSLTSDKAFVRGSLNGTMRVSPAPTKQSVQQSQSTFGGSLLLLAQSEVNRSRMSSSPMNRREQTRSGLCGIENDGMNNGVRICFNVEAAETSTSKQNFTPRYSHSTGKLSMVQLQRV